MKKTTKFLIFTALLVAVHIVLSRFLSFNAWNLKIGFSFVPIFIAATMNGPLAAIIVGALGDFLGAILFPIGPYFPGFTLSCALTGLLFGLLLYKKQTRLRIVIAVFIDQFALSLFLTSLWLHILYGTQYLALLEVRIIQSLVLAVVEFVVMIVTSKTVVVRISKLNHAQGA